MNGTTTQRRNPDDLIIDSVVTTQPELGPTIPDGGYGWTVFFVTLFFQALIPSLIVSFGIFLAFERLQNTTVEDNVPTLWDYKLLHVPLFFITSWTIFDSTSRFLIANSTWPRLVATAGTCLTCAGLLFLWMGMTGYGGTAFYILAGVISGIGSSIQMSQCELILAQYFRLKHAILVHFGQAVCSLGFILAPIAVGHHILNSSLLNVILWYQAVILQGLVLNMAFKKPLYLKSQQTNEYNYVTANPDDEEDILSKNARELQITRQDAGSIKVETHEITATDEETPSAGTSTEKNVKDTRNWETFNDSEEDEEEEEETKYEKLKDWVTFENDEETVDKPKSPTRNEKNLQLELSFGQPGDNQRPTSSISGLPLPLFSDLPVNNNNTYSYDVLEDRTETRRSNVFMPTTISKPYYLTSLEILQQPTFYKSLLTVLTMKFSVFIFFTLFPSYLYQEVANVKMRDVSTLVGLLSLSSLLFSIASYWINTDRKRRAISLWVLSWMGAVGYYLLSDYTSEFVLLLGAMQVVLSIAALQYIAGPLLGLTIRGESTKEYGLIGIMTGKIFLFFLFINPSYKDCFRLMALLHLFTGTVWFVNYLYKGMRR